MGKRRGKRRLRISTSRLKPSGSGFYESKETKRDKEKARKIVRYGGRKIKGKEAKRLKRMGISRDDLRRLAPGRLSRKASKIYRTKFKKGGKKRKGRSKSSSESSYESDYQKDYADSMDSTAELLEKFQIQQQEQQAKYEAMLAKQAEEAKKAQEEQMKMLQIQQQNAASAAQTPNFQLQGAGVTPKLGAAQQFRKRKGTQFGTGSPYTGLAQISSGMVNV